MFFGLSPFHVSRGQWIDAILAAIEFVERKVTETILIAAILKKKRNGSCLLACKSILDLYSRSSQHINNLRRSIYLYCGCLDAHCMLWFGEDVLTT